MGFGNVLELEILDHIQPGGVRAYTPPSYWYVAVGNTPTDSGITEPTTGDYARRKHKTWKAAALGSTVNSGVCSFVEATGSWLNGVSIGYFGIFDASSAGNFLIGGSIAEPKAIKSGDTLKFAAGALKIILD